MKKVLVRIESNLLWNVLKRAVELQNKVGSICSSNQLEYKKTTEPSANKRKAEEEKERKKNVPKGTSKKPKKGK